MTDSKLNIFSKVRDLSKAEAVAFCATMLERKVPNFLFFCDLMDVEGGQQMSKSLTQVWLAFEALQKGRKITTNLSLLREKVEMISPDASVMDNFGVYPAIDCAMAMVATLNLLTNDEKNGAVTVSKLSQGSVEAVILASEGEVTSEVVKQHPLMQRELDFQTTLLAMLSEKALTDLRVDHLKNMALGEGATNIGLAIA